MITLTQVRDALRERLSTQSWPTMSEYVILHIALMLPLVYDSSGLLSSAGQLNQAIVRRRLCYDTELGRAWWTAYWNELDDDNELLSFEDEESRTAACVVSAHQRRQREVSEWEDRRLQREYQRALMLAHSRPG